MFVEATAMKGKGRLMLTGSLGEVMKESAQAALSYARTRARQFGIKEDYFATHDLHVHVPEGAIPKDGPSAGITIATAMLSVLTGRPVNRSVAMTGEITLRGNVLAIGGLKEKTLAARRAGITRVICPRLNNKEIAEFPAHLKRDVEILLVDEVEEVLKLALVPPLESRPPAKAAPKTPARHYSPKTRSKPVSVQAKARRLPQS
jgi:ATP-dependent Lon protease